MQIACQKASAIIFTIGTVAAVLLVAAAYIFMNTPECPTNYTQAQVDAAHCSIGANIGFGLALLAAGVIWMCTIIVTIIVALLRKHKRPPH